MKSLAYLYTRIYRVSLAPGSVTQVNTVRPPPHHVQSPKSSKNAVVKMQTPLDRPTPVARSLFQPWRGQMLSWLHQSIDDNNDTLIPPQAWPGSWGRPETPCE